jgi:hypothetical protein
MRKLLLTLDVFFGLASAQVSLDGLKPSVALMGGSQGFGVELSWHCLLFQPPVGEVRPALDLGFTAAGEASGAFLFRYHYPFAEELRAGAGMGVGFPKFWDPKLYLRLDAEYHLKALVGAPLFLGADFGLLGDKPAGHLKLGYRF